MDVGSVYGSYYETAKSYMGLRKEEKQAGSAEKVTDKSQVSSEDMTLEEYKEYFNEKMNSLYTHPSQRNRNDIIDITDAAYKRMQTDPEYEKKILDALAKNKAVNFGNYIPQISYMHIDDTYEKCYGYTQGMKENDGYSGSSSAKGTDAGRQKKARQKELLEEYLEKRAQMKEFQQEALEEKIAKQEMLNKKIAKMELERSRQTQSWNSERQMASKQIFISQMGNTKLGFMNVPNGDVIAFDMKESEINPSVVYLSHDDGEGHGYILGKDFNTYLEQLLLVGACGNEDWQMLPFCLDAQSGIVSDCENAKEYRKLIGLQI